VFEKRRLEYLARQFACPSGWVGRWLIGPWLDRVSRSMNRLVLEELQVRPQDRVLEVGFGGGALLRSTLKRSSHVAGVEKSGAMVARARRRFAREANEGRLALHAASAEALPLADASVDKACSVNTIYFWSDPEVVMAEFARVVRPGGRLIVCFEPPEELRKWPGHEFGFRLWRGDEVARLMRNAGFGHITASWGAGRKPDHFLCLHGLRLGESETP
jgi:arsenite methyltransferase